jgi:hypothetical protein
MRGKGPGGLRIKDAVCQTIQKLKRATGKDIFEDVKKVFEWGDHAILRHIMAQTINLQPGYYEWNFVKQREKCLFLCEDGYFEVYQPDKHGIFADGILQRKI